MPHDDEDLRDTLPPSPMTEPPPPAPPEGISTLGEMSFHEDPESWAGYDESKFMHRATSSVIKLTGELLKAKQSWDIEAIVQRQAVLFADQMKPEFSALGSRVGRTEVAVQLIEKEILELKAQLEREVQRLEGEIQRVRSLATGQQQ